MMFVFLLAEEGYWRAFTVTWCYAERSCLLAESNQNYRIWI